MDKESKKDAITTTSLKDLKKKSLNEIQVPNWLAAVIILVIICVAGLFIWFKSSASKPVSVQPAPTPSTNIANEVNPGALNVEVLPQTERSFTDSDIKNPFTVQDLSTLKLTGVVSSSNGKVTAIIETEQSSYIVGIGDTMRGSTWKVKAIGERSITFSSGDNEKIIYMDKNK